jgi:hypothetical protein
VHANKNYPVKIYILFGKQADSYIEHFLILQKDSGTKQAVLEISKKKT